ncbi:MAG: hypothetical protein GX351_05545 [Peptococcaceae bacterium]|jgi:predicted RNase H-like HicB family nuclease|nr:hypothetical protein [Peptococcaceae bacterium]
MELKVSVTISKEYDLFVATCEEYDLVAKGVTIEDALIELQRKLYEYLQDEHLSVPTSFVFVIKMPI